MHILTLKEAEWRQILEFMRERIADQGLSQRAMIGPRALGITFIWELMETAERDYFLPHGGSKFRKFGKIPFKEIKKMLWRRHEVCLATDLTHELKIALGGVPVKDNVRETDAAHLLSGHERIIEITDALDREIAKLSLARKALTARISELGNHLRAINETPFTELKTCTRGPFLKAISTGEKLLTDREDNS